MATLIGYSIRNTLVKIVLFLIFQDLYQDFQRLVSVRPSHLNSTHSDENVAEVFKEAVFKLTSNPGPTEEYVKRVIELLNLGVADKNVIEEIIETLFEQVRAKRLFSFVSSQICILYVLVEHLGFVNQACSYSVSPPVPYLPDLIREDTFYVKIDKLSY